MDLSKRLSKNFTLGEFLRSATAERHEDIVKEQYNPPEEVVANLAYLCSTTLQPIRDLFGVPLRITSGYRCKKLNELVGSSNRSQHLKGQAADCQLPSKFLTHPNTLRIREKIQDRVRTMTGEPLRPDTNANFYLFAYICLRLEHLDIDQVIHEYGAGYGRPAWIHIAASPSDRDKRQMLCMGSYLPSKREVPDNIISALNYGTAQVPDLSNIA
jgi:hypothetical protein